MQHASQLPTNKTVAGGLAGALTMIVVWALHQWGKVDVPAEIAVAISTVLSFAVSWSTPPAERDYNFVPSDDETNDSRDG